MSSPITGLDLGTPAPKDKTVQSVRLIGVTQVNNFIYAFVLVKTDDDKTNLWCRYCLNGMWNDTWQLLGAPSVGISFEGTYQGTVVSAGNSIWVFVRDANGALQCNLWDGSVWQWVLIGLPTGVSSLDFVDYTLATPFCVVGGVGDQIWVANWNGAMWVWAQSAVQFSSKQTNSFFSLNPSTAFMVAFQVNTSNKLICGANLIAGIVTTGKVHFGGLDGKFKVRGINTDGTTVETGDPGVWGSGQKPVADGSVIDLKDFSQFKAGANCWVAATDSSVSQGRVHGRESNSNFNYFPDMPPISVGYFVSDKTYNDNGNRPLCFSFSNCSNY